MSFLALQAPFPWFGGKRKVAKEVWTRFGAIRNFRGTLLWERRGHAWTASADCGQRNGK